MEVDLQQRHILTACQDRNIRVYSVTNGKHGRCFRGSQGEDGTLIKVDNKKNPTIIDKYSKLSISLEMSHSE